MQNSLSMILIALIAISSLINWVAAWQWRPKLYYASKPFAIIFLIIFFVLQGPMTSQKTPFLIGLVFSFLGDLLLIPRSMRWFIAGMCAFSIAQLCYTIGFNLSLTSVPVLVLSVFALVQGGVIMHLVIDHFAKTVDINKKVLPFFKIYGVLVLAMAISAITSIARPAWPDLAAVMAGVGAMLFFVSDVMIGLDKLERRLPRYKFWIIITYHLAQFLIVGALIVM